MSFTRSTALFLAAATALLLFGTAGTAHARTPAAPTLQKIVAPQVVLPKWEAPKLLPKVQFKAKGKLNKTTAKINMYALVTFAGKTKTITIFNMGVKKKGKSVDVKRKLGKLRVALKVSWEGTRTITIKGTAKWMKIKIPMPRIRVKL